MNDERFLKDWLRDTTEDTSDPQASADRVLARVSDVRQRGRWWPWLPARRTRPRPADDDHPPTVSGRTRLMLSPVKAMAGGALALALSAAFLVAQPVDRPGGVPGAEMETDLAQPVYVTGTFIDLTCSGGSTEVEGNLERGFGETCRVDNEWSDPRLDGIETYVHNGVSYADGSVWIGHYVHDIVTDEGAWRMRPQFRFEAGSESDAESDVEEGAGNFSGTWVLDGEGAYEGLSVILDKGDNVLRGFIVPTDVVPPAPERASTE